jgi:hypothetical protein
MYISTNPSLLLKPIANMFQLGGKEQLVTSRHSIRVGSKDKLKTTVEVAILAVRLTLTMKFVQTVTVWEGGSTYISPIVRALTVGSAIAAIAATKIKETITTLDSLLKIFPFTFFMLTFYDNLLY